MTLLIPEKNDVEIDKVATAWTVRGSLVKRLGKYWIKDEALTQEAIAIYGNQAFALVLAQIYDVDLLMPDDDLTTKLESEWTKRKIELRRVEDIALGDFPVFIKPFIPKLFPAGIYPTLTDFRQAITDLPGFEFALVSSIVPDIEAEAWSFVLHGAILDMAVYEGHAHLETGRNFLTAFLNAHQALLPAAVVVDIAYSQSTGWFILEFNACWGAGLNNCDAAKVMDCFVAATVNKKSI